MLFIGIIWLAALWYLLMTGAQFLDSIPWRSPWTYVVILFLCIAFNISDLILPCILAGGVAWYFSPPQVMRREFKRREQIRADVWSERKMHHEQRRHVRNQAMREQAYERSLRQKQKSSTIYQRIQTKKAERNNVSSQMKNLYNVASSLGRDQQSRVETNQIHNQIAELKAQKIRL